MIYGKCKKEKGVYTLPTQIYVQTPYKSEFQLAPL